MHRKSRSLSRDQAAHEAVFGRGLFLWIALYLILMVAFFAVQHEHERQAVVDPSINNIERVIGAHSAASALTPARQSEIGATG